ncbi:MAG: hypothetical protein IPK60_01730 [Sandaracinaceae bacterium]|nr:hypothetical protein [Sandaracinaceae bacterium]
MSQRFVSIVVLGMALGMGVALTSACANTENHGGTDMGSTPADMGTATDLGAGTDFGPVAMCDGSSTNEDTVALCSDSCDNDGNSFVDCNDFGCCDVRTDCGPTTACGRPRDGGAPAMACDGGSEFETTIAACSDGCDNDGNNFVDCNDFACCSLVTCGTDTACGRRDGGSTVVTCTGPLVHENTVETCTDGCSNDGNAYVDCEDRNCCGIEGVTCTGTTYCATNTTPSTGCVGEIVPENTAERCADACSNDDDPFIDCDDYDCCDVSGVTCGTDTMCGMRGSDAGA